MTVTLLVSKINLQKLFFFEIPLTLSRKRCAVHKHDRKKCCRFQKKELQNTDYYTKKHNELFNKNYTQNTLYHTKKKYHYLVNENNSQNPDYYTEEDQHLYTENNSQNTNYYDKRKYDYFVNENNSPVIFTNRIMTIVSTNPCQTPNYYTKENKHFLKENDSQVFRETELAVSVNFKIIPE
ncbi:unnamed protein product [Cylicostephanus goldi]|uniref:Uncharacterized protein n=1 Tax=Cylicostephanus goldi TaxID=71465 RepID=A0A3P6RNM9_CYLGO|nr:unnamed protein product [Cylicostephanus goldi]